MPREGGASGKGGGAAKKSRSRRKRSSSQTEEGGKTFGKAGQGDARNGRLSHLSGVNHTLHNIIDFVCIFYCMAISYLSTIC